MKEEKFIDDDDIQIIMHGFGYLDKHEIVMKIFYSFKASPLNVNNLPVWNFEQLDHRLTQVDVEYMNYYVYENACEWDLQKVKKIQIFEVPKKIAPIK